mgnify:CR=1 FL=1
MEKKSAPPALPGVEGAIAVIFGAAAAGATGDWRWHCLSLLGAGLIMSSMTPSKIKQLNNVFHRAGIPADAEVRLVEEQGDNMVLTIPPGHSVDMYNRIAPAVASLYGEHAEVSFKLIGRSTMLMQVKTSALPSKINYCPVPLKLCQVPIGYDQSGDLKTFTFCDTSPALLVAGMTGMGKTSLIRIFLTTFMLSDPGRIRLWLTDLKGVEFDAYIDSAFVERCAFTNDEARQLFNDLTVEMERRYSLFRKQGVNNISDYRGDMPYIISIVDEYSMLKHDDDVQYTVDKLLKLSRAAGIYHILATQRPDRESIPGYIKANIESSVCLKVRQRVNSQIVLDCDDAAELPTIPGRAIFQHGPNVVVQIPYLSKQQSINLVKHTFRKKAYTNNTSGVVPC